MAALGVGNWEIAVGVGAIPNLMAALAMAHKITIMLAQQFDNFFIQFRHNVNAPVPEMALYARN
jgi:hypothetical protein